MSKPTPPPDPPLLKCEVEMLREVIRKVYELSEECEDLGKVSRALQSISQAIANLSRLVQAENQPKSQKQEFEEAYQLAMDEVWKELGIDE